MLGMMRVSAAVWLLLVVTGCGAGRSVGTLASDSAGAEDAAAECAGPALTYAKGFGGTATVAASYASTASAVAAWQEQPRGASEGHVTRSQWRDVASSAAVTVCVLDGSFPAAPGVPGGPDTATSYTRLVVEVSGGQVTPDLVGPQDKVPISGPKGP